MRRVFVSGKVQHVGYRDWIVRRAGELKLAGRVRNCTDGRVEILIAGDDEATDALVDAARQGPPRARVDNVEAHLADERLPKGFTKRFTA